MVASEELYKVFLPLARKQNRGFIGRVHHYGPSRASYSAFVHAITLYEQCKGSARATVAQTEWWLWWLNTPWEGAALSSDRPFAKSSNKHTRCSAPYGRGVDVMCHVLSARRFEFS